VCSSDLIAHLKSLSGNAEFTQLVRLAKRIAARFNIDIEYQVAPQLNFPVHDVAKITHDSSHNEKLILLVRFMGLIGVTGVLPEHYTEYLLQRLQAKDSTLLAFLDVFHDRLLHLFYETKNISRFYLDEQQQSHIIPQLLKAIAGKSTTEKNDWHCYYAGILGHQSRSLTGLVQLLSDHFGLSISMTSYTPTWYRLKANETSKLGRANHSLTKTALLGKRITNVQDKFTLHIVVDDYATFQQCLPGSELLQQLSQIVRAYCGIQYECDLTVAIAQKHLPKVRLTKQRTSFLGWNSTLSLHQSSEKQQIIAISAREFYKVVA
jgi:type VI secretion system protein ImpH